MARRKLTEANIQFINKAHPEFLAEEIAEKLPAGIGVKTVQDYIDANLAQGEAPQPVINDKLAPSKKHESKGFAISTEADSAMSDARRTHALKEASKGQKERAKGHIHVPFD